VWRLNFSLVKEGRDDMKFKTTLILFLVIGIVMALAGCSSNNNSSGDQTSIKTNISQTPDGKPVTEFFVSTPYSKDKDSWIKDYAKQHHTNSNPEMFLFTFSNGKQFEYDYTGIGSYNQGMLLPGNWTEEPNESLKPTQISEQQFDTNMNSILSKWSGSSYKWNTDSTYGEVLAVYIGEKAAVTGYDVEASILKNYIDLKPDRTSYAMVLVTPGEISGMNMVNALVFTPKDCKIIEVDKTGSDSTGTQTVWTDATYTSIVNAIEANDFTNNPAKVGTIES
jgi:hypothetical protein